MFAIAKLAIVFNLISLNLSHVDSLLNVTEYSILKACGGEWMYFVLVYNLSIAFMYHENTKEI